MSRQRTGLHKGLTVHLFLRPDDWMTWLKKNHSQSQSIWLKFAKKKSRKRSVTYEEAREGALIYGWIDGLINSLSDDYYLIKFSPRRPKSRWSKINRDIADGLIQAGKMQPSGLAQVEAAQSDGRWAAAYDSSSTIQVPPDLDKQLTGDPKAQAAFEKLTRTQRYGLLMRIEMARRAETRQKRIDEALQSLRDSTATSPHARRKTPCQVVLLRGINVSGKKLIKMVQLRDVLATAGLSDVKTYLQSGNLVIRSSQKPDRLGNLIRQQIQEHWGFDVPVFVRPAKTLERMVLANPFGSLDSTKLAITLLDQKVTKTVARQALKPLIRGEERFEPHGDIIYLHCPSGFGRTKLTNNAIEKGLQVHATTRNWKTINALHKLSQDASSQ